jgi:hypothetical protein
LARTESFGTFVVAFKAKKAEHDISISGEKEVVIATEIFKILSYA